MLFKMLFFFGLNHIPRCSPPQEPDHGGKAFRQLLLLCELYESHMAPLGLCRGTGRQESGSQMAMAQLKEGPGTSCRHPPCSWQDLYASTETYISSLPRLTPNFGPVAFLFKDIHHISATTAVRGPTHLCSTGKCHKYTHFTGRGLRQREQQQYTQGLGQNRDLNPCESHRHYPSS